MKNEKEGSLPAGAEAPRGIGDTLSLTWLVLRESVRSFGLNNNFQTAATLAYYGFFSLIPLLLLVLILLSRLTLSSQAVMSGISSISAETLPKFSEVIVQEISSLANQKTWGWVSIVALLWAVTPLASSIRSVLIQIFKRERRETFFKAKLLTVAGALALLALFMFLVVGKLVFSFLEREVLPTAQVPEAKWLNFLVSFPAAIVFVLFFYLVFCPVKLSWGERLAGATVTTLLLFIIRPAFALVLRFNPNYGYAFGSLKAIFLLTVWIYYSFLVILFGAEVVANIRRREALLLRGLFLKTLPPGTRIGPLLRRFVRQLRAPEAFFHEGDPGAEMYYILSGAVRLEKGSKTIGALQEGDYFGEMSMLLNEPRTATARADSPEVTLIVISRRNFEAILKDNPEIVSGILRVLAKRLKETTARI